MPYPNTRDSVERDGSIVRYRRGSFSRAPLAPDRMQERVTRTEDLFVLCHLGVPQLELESWSLTIDGLVARPLRLDFSDLTTYPRHTITSFHQCCGSPLEPFVPTRRISNVRWSGVRLFEILRDCVPAPEAKYLWSYGADYGEFFGTYHEAYWKDLPLERVAADVLIAYELNGAPLPVEHGFPARLVVPGFYGTNSVKWLTRITVAQTRATGPFTTRWYNDSVHNAAGKGSRETVPVYAVAPESIIVSPAAGEVLERETMHEVWGWAWADSGIDRVAVSADGGATWMEANVEPRLQRAWQRFDFSWYATGPGPVTLCSKAYACDGAKQPEFGYRNAIHRVEVKVV